MIYLQIFLYYIAFSSIVLVYGVGINSIAEFGVSKKNDLMYFIKAVLTIYCTSMISWLIISKILVPLKLIELYPLVTFIIFASINGLLEGIVRIVTGKSSTEFIITYLIILISLSESTNILNVLVVCSASLVCFLILIFLGFAFKSRVLANGSRINENYYSLFFIFLAILIIVISVWDIVWINPGVLR